MHQAGRTGRRKLRSSGTCCLAFWVFATWHLSLVTRHWPRHSSLVLASSLSITPPIILLVIIDERLVHHAIAAGRRVLAGKIPIATVVRHCEMQVFDRLKNDLDVAFPVREL